MAEINKPLDKVIEVDGEKYDVYAVHADTAENAEKLGNVAAENYAKKNDLPTDTNQKVKVGSTTFGNNDIVDFVAGSNVTITPNAADKTITISSTGGGAGGVSDVASKIKVTMDDDTKDATITIKSSDPSGGNVGDIWFKY